jgi:hypothetical protein
MSSMSADISGHIVLLSAAVWGKYINGCFYHQSYSSYRTSQAAVCLCGQACSRTSKYYGHTHDCRRLQ